MKTIIRLVGTLSLLLIAVMGITYGRAPAAHGAAPTDRSKNYHYGLQTGAKCLNGDLVEYDQKDGTAIGCVRLGSKAADGYSVATLVANGVTSDGKTCGTGGAFGTTGGPVFLVKGIGWQCITVTDSARWDTTDYSSNSNAGDITPGKKCGVLPINCDGSGVNGGNGIFDLVNFAINWIIRLLGVAAIISIIVAGIQYITSQGSPDALKSAKSRITNAVVGLILLSLMFVILKFLGVMN